MANGAGARTVTKILLKWTPAFIGGRALDRAHKHLSEDDQIALAHYRKGAAFSGSVALAGLVSMHPVLAALVLGSNRMLQAGATTAKQGYEFWDRVALAVEKGRSEIRRERSWARPQPTGGFLDEIAPTVSNTLNDFFARSITDHFPMGEDAQSREAAFRALDPVERARLDSLIGSRRWHAMAAGIGGGLAFMAAQPVMPIVALATGFYALGEMQMTRGDRDILRRLRVHMYELSQQQGAQTQKPGRKTAKAVREEEKAKPASEPENTDNETKAKTAPEKAEKPSADELMKDLDIQIIDPNDKGPKDPPRTP